MNHFWFPFCLLFLIYQSGLSQATNEIIEHEIYITGNTADVLKNNHLSRLSTVLKNQSVPTTLIYCGDILPASGSHHKLTGADTSIVKRLLDVGEANDRIAIYFVPGDDDLGDLEKLVNGLSGKQIFLPASGCAGPEIVSVSNNIDIAFINTTWLINTRDRLYAPADDCKSQEENQFKEFFEDILGEANGKNLLVAGHHPVISYGKYGGRYTIRDYFSPPLAGIFSASYHQNVGTERDMSFPEYNNFSHYMKLVMNGSPPFIYASSHEKNMQVIKVDSSYQVISGAIGSAASCGKTAHTIYKSCDPGFIKLSYYANGKIMLAAYTIDDNNEVKIKSTVLYRSACTSENDVSPVNSRFIPCNNINNTAPDSITPITADSGLAVGGSEYKAGKIKNMLMGTLYRSSWTAEINIPIINLDTARGGLTPTGIGGGRQTHSLSLSGNDGKSYVFRSVDKDPVKALNPELRKTFLANLVREFTATQNPYGALPAKYLLDATTIFHSRPELYKLPDNNSLGIYRNSFGGMLGMLEEKPKKNRVTGLGTFGANEFIRTLELFRKLYKDNDNRVDAHAFLTARIFDMFIGDWGKHEDNWTWAGFKTGDKTIYYPVPRDRDHAFSRWNGLLPYLVSRKWALPNAENFGENFEDIQSLNYPARFLDRYLLSELSEKEWTDIAVLLQSQMTDALIDSAIQQFPKEIIPLSGEEIGRKLKSRRNELTVAIIKYYKQLAKNIYVLGSNKQENFSIERFPDKSVMVTVTKKPSATDSSTTVLYKRHIKNNETDNVTIYGLDGDDTFTLTGASTGPIKIRISGGKGDDIFTDNSIGKRKGKNTEIFEYKKGDHNLIAKGKCTKLLLSDDRSRGEFTRRPEELSTESYVPGIFYTKEDGVEYNLGITQVFHSFAEDEYTNKLVVSSQFSSKGYLQFRLVNEIHHLIGKWNLLIKCALSIPYPDLYFYGAGNETVISSSVPKSFYTSRLSGYSAGTGLQRVFLRKSNFYLGLTYESYDLSIPQNNIASYPDAWPGNNLTNFTTAVTSLDIDFRDRTFFPKRGVRLYLNHSSYFANSADDKNFGNSGAAFEFYQTNRTLIPVTLGLIAGFGTSTDNTPFYKLPAIGRTTGLRGYDRNRFTGKSAATLSSNLSFELGKINTSFIPLTMGIFGFYDAGRVWVKNDLSNKIHSGYGGGIYLVPMVSNFTMRFSIAFSDENKKGIFEAGLGARF